VPRSPENWLLFVDADILLGLAPDYGHRIKACIEANPQFTHFTCMTNRCGYKHQVHSEYTGDNIAKHRGVNDELWKEHGTRVDDITDLNGYPTGMVMAIRSDVWPEVKGMPRGMLGVDTAIFCSLQKAGHRTGLMRGIYAYHWYRGGKAHDKKHLL
jgi:hypothetical protein